MKRLVKDKIYAMANVRGRTVRNPNPLPFSFYFSNSYGIDNNVRVKVSFNPDKLSIDQLGNLELHSDWKFVPGKDDKHLSNKDVAEMKNFFRKYKVLFCLVWDHKLQEDEVQDYFRGIFGFIGYMQVSEYS